MQFDNAFVAAPFLNILQLRPIDLLYYLLLVEETIFIYIITSRFHTESHIFGCLIPVGLRQAPVLRPNYRFGLTPLVQSASLRCQAERLTFSASYCIRTYRYYILLACSALARARAVPRGTCGENIRPDAIVWVCRVPYRYAYEERLSKI